MSSDSSVFTGENLEETKAKSDVELAEKSKTGKRTRY